MSEDFFGRPPPPPEEHDFRPERYPWTGAPANVLGAAVAVDLLLARTDGLVMAVPSVTAYPEGFEFSLNIRARDAWDPEFAEALHGPVWPRHRGALESREWPPDVLRLGLRFSDGSKATTTSGLPDDPRHRPDRPVLMGGGGGGGGGRWQQEYWVWPLPPEGPLWFVCEWPAQGVPFTEVQTDAGAIRQAARRAQLLWPNSEGGDAALGSAWEPLRPLG